MHYTQHGKNEGRVYPCDSNSITLQAVHGQGTQMTHIFGAFGRAIPTTQTTKTTTTNMSIAGAVDENQRVARINRVSLALPGHHSHALYTTDAHDIRALNGTQPLDDLHTTMPGFRGGSHFNYDSTGTLGQLQTGMSQQDCIKVAMQHGWKNAGHRNSTHADPSFRNTCFLHRFERDVTALFNQNQGVGDSVHTTTRLTVTAKSDDLGARVFENAHFKGKEVHLGAGQYKLQNGMLQGPNWSAKIHDHGTHTSGMANDQISSIIVEPGYTVTVYDHNKKGDIFWMDNDQLAQGRTIRGFYDAGEGHTDYDRSGTLGRLQTGMSEQDCIQVAMQNGWKNAGHRTSGHPIARYRNTCFLTRPESKVDTLFNQGKPGNTPSVHTTTQLHATTTGVGGQQTFVGGNTGRTVSFMPMYNDRISSILVRKSSVAETFTTQMEAALGKGIRAVVLFHLDFRRDQQGHRQTVIGTGHWDLQRDLNWISENDAHREIPRYFTNAYNSTGPTKGYAFYRDCTHIYIPAGFAVVLYFHNYSRSTHRITYHFSSHERLIYLDHSRGQKIKQVYVSAEVYVGPGDVAAKQREYNEKLGKLVRAWHDTMESTKTTKEDVTATNSISDSDISDVAVSYTTNADTNIRAFLLNDGTALLDLSRLHQYANKQPVQGWVHFTQKRHLLQRTTLSAKSRQIVEKQLQPAYQEIEDILKLKDAFRFRLFLADRYSRPYGDWGKPYHIDKVKYHEHLLKIQFGSRGYAVWGLAAKEAGTKRGNILYHHRNVGYALPITAGEKYVDISVADTTNDFIWAVHVDGYVHFAYIDKFRSGADYFLDLIKAFNNRGIFNHAPGDLSRLYQNNSAQFVRKIEHPSKQKFTAVESSSNKGRNGIYAFLVDDIGDLYHVIVDDSKGNQFVEGYTVKANRVYLPYKVQNVSVVGDRSKGDEVVVLSMGKQIKRYKNYDIFTQTPAEHGGVTQTALTPFQTGNGLLQKSVQEGTAKWTVPQYYDSGALQRTLHSVNSALTIEETEVAAPDQFVCSTATDNVWQQQTEITGEYAETVEACANKANGKQWQVTAAVNKKTTENIGLYMGRRIRSVRNLPVSISDQDIQAITSEGYLSNQVEAPDGTLHNVDTKRFYVIPSIPEEACESTCLANTTCSAYVYLKDKSYCVHRKDGVDESAVGFAVGGSRLTTTPYIDAIMRTAANFATETNKVLSDPIQHISREMSTGPHTSCTAWAEKDKACYLLSHKPPHVTNTDVDKKMKHTPIQGSYLSVTHTGESAWIGGRHGPSWFIYNVRMQRSWTKKVFTQGDLNGLCITGDGHHLWCISGGVLYHIRARDWHNSKSPHWDQVQPPQGQTITSVSVAEHNKIIWVTTNQTNKNVYFAVPSAELDTVDWQHSAQATLAGVRTSGDGRHTVGLASAGGRMALFEYGHKTDHKWTSHANNPSTLLAVPSLSSDASVMVAFWSDQKDKKQYTIIKKQDTWDSKKQELPFAGTLCRVEVSGDASQYYVLTTSGNLLYSHATEDWKNELVDLTIKSVKTNMLDIVQQPALSSTTENDDGMLEASEKPHVHMQWASDPAIHHFGELTKTNNRNKSYHRKTFDRANEDIGLFDTTSNSCAAEEKGFQRKNHVCVWQKESPGYVVTSHKVLQTTDEAAAFVECQKLSTEKNATKHRTILGHPQNKNRICYSPQRRKQNPTTPLQFSTWTSAARDGDKNKAMATFFECTRSEPKRWWESGTLVRATGIDRVFWGRILGWDHSLDTVNTASGINDDTSMMSVLTRISKGERPDDVMTDICTNNSSVACVTEKAAWQKAYWRNTKAAYDMYNAVPQKLPVNATYRTYNGDINRSMWNRLHCNVPYKGTCDDAVTRSKVFYLRTKESKYVGISINTPANNEDEKYDKARRYETMSYKENAEHSMFFYARETQSIGDFFNAATDNRVHQWKKDFSGPLADFVVGKIHIWKNDEACSKREKRMCLTYKDHGPVKLLYQAEDDGKDKAVQTQTENGPTPDQSKQLFMFHKSLANFRPEQHEQSDNLSTRIFTYALNQPQWWVLENHSERVVLGQARGGIDDMKDTVHDPHRKYTAHPIAKVHDAAIWSSHVSKNFNRDLFKQ